MLSPERKAPKKEREYAAKRLDETIAKIKNVMQRTLQKVQNKLMEPAIKKTGTEKIQKQARASVLNKLHQKQDTLKREALSQKINRRNQSHSNKL